MQTARNYSLDVLRVVACLLVIWQHASEHYYIMYDGHLSHESSTAVIAFLNSLSRSCVPLFAMISGYFLLPMKDSATVFLRKRLTRILGPFVFWCVAYAVYYVFYWDQSLGQCLRNIAHIPVNYGTEVGHLWYVYMLLGLYLLVPILSPWLQQCSRRQLQVYLGLWVLTTLLPYIHLVYPEVLGECFWNQSPMLYYFNGFVGYFILGHYARRYGLPGVKTSLVLLLVGYAVTSAVFYLRIENAIWASEAELSWEFCSANVAMMTVALFALVLHLPAMKERRLLTEVAMAGYAIYLAHIMVLNFFLDQLAGHLSTVAIEIPVISVITLVVTYLLVKFLSFLPKSKYWLGA